VVSLLNDQVYKRVYKTFADFNEIGININIPSDRKSIGSQISALEAVMKIANR
jgi:hypothetical protein